VILPSKKINLIKRTVLLLFTCSLVFVPSQNFYATLNLDQHPSFSLSTLPQTPVLPYPQNTSRPDPPKLTANAIMVLDRDSGVPLYSRNENNRFLPASTVKIMTFLVAQDYYQSDQVLTVPELNISGQNNRFYSGEQITVKNLLYGLLVASANDAAFVLSTNYPGGEDSFVQKMNQKAQQLHLYRSYFANPAGLDSDSNNKILTDYSYTTAFDLARLAKAALQNPLFAEIVATKSITITDVSGKIVHPLTNVNELLGKIPGLKGVKTGYTEEAGECLVTYTERQNHGIIAVVLGSKDRFGDSQKLIDWSFSSFTWQTLTPPI